MYCAQQVWELHNTEEQLLGINQKPLLCTYPREGEENVISKSLGHIIFSKDNSLQQCWCKIEKWSICCWTSKLQNSFQLLVKKVEKCLKPLCPSSRSSQELPFVLSSSETPQLSCGLQSHCRIQVLTWQQLLITMIQNLFLIKERKRSFFSKLRIDHISPH